MTTIQELVQIIIACILSFGKAYAGKFVLTLTIAALLSALCWFVCTKWTYLWNKRFIARPPHHAFCGMASILTFLFVLTFPSLAFLKPLADLAVFRWSAMLKLAAGDSMLTSVTLSREEINRAERWDAETFLTARHEVFVAHKAGQAPGMPYSQSAWRGTHEESNYTLNPNNTAMNAAALRKLAASKGWTLDSDEQYEQPRTDAPQIPIGGRLGEVSSKVYAEQAISLFREMNPFLSRVVWPPSEKIPQNLIVDDIREFQSANPGKIYNLSQGIQIARKQVSLKLAERTPRVVTIGRWILFGLFLAAQSVPFGLVGWAAYTDLKTFRSSGPSRRTSSITSTTTSRAGSTSRHRVSPRSRS